MRAIFILLLLASLANAWVTPGPATSRATTRLFAIESVSLDSLSLDHEEEGTRMATSITKWLDAEWIPQQVHVEMAESAKCSYIATRTDANEDDDIMTIMMSVANDLDQNWAKYDADAFVNAWDVANYVSDYLTDRAGASDDCQCSETIH